MKKIKLISENTRKNIDNRRVDAMVRGNVLRFVIGGQRCPVRGEKPYSVQIVTTTRQRREILFSADSPDTSRSPRRSRVRNSSPDHTPEGLSPVRCRRCCGGCHRDAPDRKQVPFGCRARP